MGMRLIDDSPSSFITLCFVVLYTVVGVEAAMLLSGSMAILVVTFLTIALIAAAICAWMFRLLDDGAPTVTHVAVAPEPEPEPVVVPAPERTAPRPGRAVILT
jgi:hypothetical protein